MKSLGVANLSWHHILGLLLATLHHEIGNHTVETHPVVEPLIDVLNKVVAMERRLVVEHQHNFTLRGIESNIGYLLG